MKTFLVKRCAPIRTTITVPETKASPIAAPCLPRLPRCSTITGFLESEDCLSTVNAMRSLGATIEHTAEGTFVIEGGRAIHRSDSVVDCGNSGTTMRLISGILAAQPFRSRLTGDASSQAPDGPRDNPLTEMGGRFQCEGAEPGRPPLVIEGGSLNQSPTKCP